MNEDAYRCVVPGEPGYDPRINGAIFVLADGMGGRAGGEVASHIVVRETIRAYANTPIDASPDKRLYRAIAQANDSVISEAANSPDISDMGSTVVACTLRDGQLVVANVGDSRAYLLRGCAIHRLTADHNYPNEVLKLPPHEADKHPMKNIITRVMGRPGTEPDVKMLNCRAGDRVLLCSDGVSNGVTDAELHSALKLPSPDDAVTQIMKLAKPRAEDNITAIVIYVPDEKKPPIDLWRLIAAMAGGFLALVLLVAIFWATGPNPSTKTITNGTGGEVTIRKLCSTDTVAIKPGGKWKGSPGKYCLTLGGEDYDVDVRWNLTIDNNMANARKRSVVRF